ncbi:MAG TPA: hydrogenase maturation protease [Planctomycetaceae bacterium]|nr:hydrogenase maturation protease [Planctomycetaceae bacterium]HIQ20382.1 hydrogenase maturation protease [Planctomycetota bacterium]
MGAPSAKTLLIGFGNPGRYDDGLGPALAEIALGWKLPSLTVLSNYQLAVEDAAAVAEHTRVLFADASRAGPEPFCIQPLKPRAEWASFSTHALRPEAVLALAHELFGAQVPAWLIAIRGYRFDPFGEGLSPQASENLRAAAAHLYRALRDGYIGTYEPPGAGQSAPSGHEEPHNRDGDHLNSSGSADGKRDGLPADRQSFHGD